MLATQIFTISSEEDFERIALAVFKQQATQNIVYATFIKHLNIAINTVSCIEEIPFLPIQFFKSHKIVTTNKSIEAVFSSSGTSGNTTSKHYVADLKVYQQSFQKSFQHFYGNIKEYTILALLPSYLEQKDSSLIYMADALIQQSTKKESGFFLDNISALITTLQSLEKRQEKVLLLGVSYALLDLVETQQFDLKNTIVMETGGMKGRRKEMVREELHALLCKGFGVSKIHSEYGMTELLSQAYSKGNGVFKTPSWMRVLIRDTEDALSLKPKGSSGAINVIDLANIHSCSFIATDDLGKVYPNNTFEILGRFDNADIRGCNLLLIE